MNHPFVIKLPKNKNIELNEKKENIIFSPVLTYPLLTLGFHSYIHRTRSAMEITKNLQTKNKFYYVVNPFETDISNYEDDIKNSTKLYFKSNDVSTDFLKLWEIFFIFNIINKNIKNVYINSSSNVDEILDAYTNKLGLKFKINLVKKESKSLDLIICNTEINSDTDIPDNFIEQYFYKEFISHTLSILNNLNNEGNAIVKFYDSLSLATIKIIYILSTFFEDSLVYKPFTSRQSDSERYLILKNFKGTKNSDKIIKILESIYENYEDNKKKYVQDILPDLDIPKEWMNIFKFINIRLVNNQQIMINEIVKYIKENNYFGDKYHIFRDKQIESSNWWIKNFYPPSENVYQKNKEDLDKLYKATQEKLNLESQKFSEILTN